MWRLDSRSGDEMFPSGDGDPSGDLLREFPGQRAHSAGESSPNMIGELNGDASAGDTTVGATSGDLSASWWRATWPSRSLAITERRAQP
jgi:hypothetical protein